MKKEFLGSEKYAHYSNDILMHAYEEGPKRMRKCLAGLTMKDLRIKPILGKWSIAEIAIHVTESEIVGACRVRQAYANHPGPFPYYDEAAWAIMMRYQEQPHKFILHNLRLFRLLRDTTLNLFRNLQGEEWGRTGIHPERGPMTMRGLLELYADHSERHIAQILHRRALIGKGVNMELILKDRLY